jgi:purine-binding chemotaxis protein CheW
MKSSYLLFVLAGRLCGIRLSGAVEILPWRPTRRVPLSYAYVEGLLDYRGILYPVYALARRLGLQAPDAGGDDGRASGGRSIILLEEAGAPLGIVVDSVLRMMNLEEPAHPDQVQGVDPLYVKGLSYDDNQEIMILDVERLLHAD